MFTIFDDIGATLNRIAEIIFRICIVIGSILLLFGLLIIIFDGDTSFIDVIENKILYGNVFRARILIITGLCMGASALSILPLYALGDIVYYCREIRNNTAELVKKSKENKE